MRLLVICSFFVARWPSTWNRGRERSNNPKTSSMQIVDKVNNDYKKIYPILVWHVIAIASVHSTLRKRPVSFCMYDVTVDIGLVPYLTIDCLGGNQENFNLLRH